MTARDVFGALHGFLRWVQFEGWDEVMAVMNAAEGILPNGQGSPPP